MPLSLGVYEFDPVSICSLELGEHNLCAFLDYRAFVGGAVALFLDDSASRTHLWVSLSLRERSASLLLLDVLTMTAICMRLLD